MSSNETWTIGRLITWTQGFLKSKGSESPRLDADVLLASVLGCERIGLYTMWETEVGSSDRTAYRKLIRERADGKPVAYLVGRKEFFSIPLSVSPAVLIPRPDSEFVVVEALDFLRDLEKPLVLDIGTGSGNLGIAIAKHHPNADVIAIDISNEALEVARTNANSAEVADRIHLLQGNLFEPLSTDHEPFDLIVSNPPYIPTEDILTLEFGVRNFEPHLALDGGPDGLQVVTQIIQNASSRLRKGGALILEIGTSQERPVRELLSAEPSFHLAPTIKDDGGHPRVIRATSSISDS